MPALLFHIENRIATITLNRPEKRNALSHELVEELSDGEHWSSLAGATLLVFPVVVRVVVVAALHH